MLGFKLSFNIMSVNITNTNVILYNQVYNIVNGIEEGKIITKNIRASGLIKEGRIRFGFLGSPVHIFLVFERT